MEKPKSSGFNPDVDLDLKRKPISRKKFLTLMGIGAIYTAFIVKEKINSLKEAGGKAYFTIKDYFDDWEKAKVSNNDFLRNNSDSLENLRIGCTFVPEVFWSILGEVPWELKQKTALRALEFIVNDLDMKDIRFGIRPSTVLKEDGTIDISAYKPLLKFCGENKVNLCLSQGWAKSPRWPENHPPEYLKQKDILPLERAIIKPQTPFAEMGINYLKNLNKKIKEELGTTFMNNIKMIQPENEPFEPFNFGEYGWKLSSEYLFKVVETLSEYFPGKEILINSSGPFDMEKIKDFEKMLQEKARVNPKMSKRTKYGFDYYYQIGDKKIKNIPSAEWVMEHTDIIAVYKTLGKNLYPPDVSVEVTEGQMVEWGNYKKSGNSIEHLKFMILRCSKNLLPKREDRLLRVWGVEEIALKNILKKFRKDYEQYLPAEKFKEYEFTKEHEGMVEVINKINRKGKEKV